MVFLIKARVLTSVLSDDFSDDDDHHHHLSLSLSHHCRPHCCMYPVAEGHLTSHTLAVSICYLAVIFPPLHVVSLLGMSVQFVLFCVWNGVLHFSEISNSLQGITGTYMEELFVSRLTCELVSTG
jgi:hypothetical protein